jgi:hypothetical protein
VQDDFFRQWLKRQRHRDDPVGDLARDFFDDWTAKRLSSVEQVRRHILARTTCPNVIAALDWAIAEYLTEQFLEVNCG